MIKEQPVTDSPGGWTPGSPVMSQQVSHSSAIELALLHDLCADMFSEILVSHMCETLSIQMPLAGVACTQHG